MKADELKLQISKEQSKLENRISRELIMQYLRTGIKKSAQVLIDWLIDKIVLYDDKIEIFYLYTEKTAPDDCRGFVIRWLIFCFETRHYSKNELNKRVQLIPTWLPPVRFELTTYISRHFIDNHYQYPEFYFHQDVRILTTHPFPFVVYGSFH